MSRLLRGGALGILVALVSAALVPNAAHGAQQSSAGPAQLLWAHEDAPLDLNNPFRAVITKIDPVQSVPLLSFEQGYLGLYAPSIGVDGKRETVWALGGAALKAFDVAGTLLHTVVLAESAYSGDLAVNPTDGTLWVTFSHSSDPVTFRLQHRDAQGQLLLDVSSTTLSYRHLTLDPPRGRAWVARQDEMGRPRGVEAYDDTGQVVLTLPGTLQPCALEADPDTGQLWVRLAGTIQRYSATGALELSVAAPGAWNWTHWGCGLRRDGQGGVWVQSAGSLYRLSATGTTIAALDPWPGFPIAVHAIAADQTDQSVWVATANYDPDFGAFYKPVDLWHVSGTGQVLNQIRLRDADAGGGVPYARVYQLVLSTAPTPPSLTFATPANGSVLGTGTPLIEVAYTTGDAAIDPAALAFTENGQPLAVTCTHSDTISSCTPNAPLADGAHTISATVADVEGRVSAPAEVTFTVDTVPPTVTLTAPPEGLVTNQTQQAVEGEVSEGATLVVKRNAEAVESFSVPSAAAFATNPVPLTEGGNQLEVRALDRAGNPGQARRNVTLDTVPPAAVVVGNLTISPPEEGEVTVTGTAGSVEAGARVTITNLRTLVSVTVVAGADGSFVATLAAQAGDALTVVTADAAGNASGTTETNVPNALQIRITEPAAGTTLTAGTVLVRGTISGSLDTALGVSVNGIPALVHGDGFTASILVDETVTSLTATASDLDGPLASDQVPIVVEVGQGEPLVRLIADANGGLAPLTVRFRLSSVVPVSLVELDANGDGTVDLRGSDLDGDAFTYTAVGAYVPTVRVTDDQGQVHVASLLVQVYDLAVLNTRLQSVWQGFRDTLRSGDVSRAVSFLHTDSREAYATQLSRFSAAALVDIDRYMTAIQFVEAGPGGAQYEMVRVRDGVTLSFAVWFQVDEDGVWRLRSF